jgi:predicted phosphohydrolase
MRLCDAAPDLMALGTLPGLKIILRGNHDYWWNALAQVRAALPPTVKALQNDAIILGNIAIAGSRGWSCPDPNQPSYNDDSKIYKRELIRLEMSISDAKRKAPHRPLIMMTHYPPFRDRYEPSPITDMIEDSGAALAIYGHLHGEEGFAPVAPHTRNGVAYHLVSCDGLGFRLKDLGEW